MQCEVWSVECEDFASSLAEKKTRRGKDTVGTGFSSNYRSFIFGKLPPPACPGTCIYIYIYYIRNIIAVVQVHGKAGGRRLHET